MNLKELDNFSLSDAIKFHDQLNPALFNDEHMKPEVRHKLLEISEEFVDSLGINQLHIKDIVVSGSNAAYSYTDHSDIDLHIITDMNEFNNNNIYLELFTAKKNIFNDDHNIKIKGYDVEVYVQDSNKPVRTLGEYSVLNNKWTKLPSKRRANFDQSSVELKFTKLIQLSELALRDTNIDKLQNLLATLRKYRQAGLDEHGEFGPENLAYKALRTHGYVDKLYDHLNDLISKKLSLDEMIAEQREPLVWLKGKLSGSYTDKQLKDMGARLHNGQWVMTKARFDTLIRLGQLRESTSRLSVTKDLNEFASGSGDDDFGNNIVSLDTVAKIIAMEFGNNVTITKGTNKNQPSFKISPNNQSNNSIRVWTTRHPRTKQVNPTYNTILFIDNYGKRVETAKSSTYANALSTAKLLKKPQDVTENTSSIRLKDLARVSVNMPDADFWIIRKGSDKTVGTPVKEFNPERIGVKIVRTDVLEPQYLYYAIMHLHNQGYFAKVAVGTLKLVNIKVADVANISLGQQTVDEDYHSSDRPPGPEFPPTMPRGTVKVDVSDVYDWYKLGQHISNLKGLGKHDFGKGPPSTIISFGDEDTEHKYIKDLEKTGLSTTDIDPSDPKQPKNMKRQKVDPTYNVAEDKITLSTDPNWYGATINNYKATGPVVNIPVNQLVGFEPDDKMNQPKSKANVEKIVMGLKRGDKLPPLLVRKYKNGYQVLDGHHRFWAYKLVGTKTIPVQVVPDSDIEEKSQQVVSEATPFPKSNDYIADELDKLQQYCEQNNMINLTEVVKALSMMFRESMKTGIEMFYWLKNEDYRRAKWINKNLKTVGNKIDLSLLIRRELARKKNRVTEASGYIPSEAEKNDPRFKTALTVDIHPNTMKQNAKKLGSKISRAGIPPILKPSGKI